MLRVVVATTVARASLGVATALVATSPVRAVLVEAAPGGPTWAMLEPERAPRSAWGVLEAKLTSSAVLGAILDACNGEHLAAEGTPEQSLPILAGDIEPRGESVRATMISAATWLASAQWEVVLHLGALVGTGLATYGLAPDELVIVGGASDEGWTAWRASAVGADARHVHMLAAGAQQGWQVAVSELTDKPVRDVGWVEEAASLAAWQRAVVARRGRLWRWAVQVREVVA